MLFRGLSRDSLEGCSRPPRIPSQVEDQADRGDVQGMGLLLALHVGHVCQEARQGLVGVLEERLPLVEGIDLSHVLVRQREIEEVDVVRDVRGRLRTRDDDVPLLDVPTQQHLGGGLAVLLGDALDDGFGHDRIVAASAQRVPRLQCDVVLREEHLELRLREVGVALDLVDGGDDLALVEDALRLGHVEVRQADRANLAFLVRLLEDAVPRDGVSRGLVQDHQVDVVRAQALERLVDGGGAFEERRPELRLEEDLLARLRGRAHSAADAALVDVDVRRVDQRVAVVQRERHGGLGVVRLQQVRAEADLGDFDAVVQGDEVHVSSFVLIRCVRWKGNAVAELRSRL